ncbi:hypothetical protein DFH11DRAFT_1731606 [Phellopilus nigrolimitatus]|nr:hypothetical protein DFH11DRAFT_1731606 [Phellopilus nigrolimitatus]
MEKAMRSVLQFNTLSTLTNLLMEMWKLGFIEDLIDCGKLTARYFRIFGIEEALFKDDLDETANYQLLVDGLEEARSTLRNLSKGANALLDVYKPRTRARLAAQESITFENPVGIMDLPDEILGDIFEAVFDMDRGFSQPDVRKTSMRVSHVCGRFRLIALGLPHLWSAVSSYFHPDLLDTCLTRSKNARLDVYMNMETSFIRYSKLDFDDFLRAVVLHSNRWQKLKIATCSAEARKSSSPQIHALRDVLDLQSLEVLIMQCFNPNDQDDVVDVIGEECAHFYRSWNMPNLRNLTASNSLEVLHHFAALPASTSMLTSCKLIFGMCLQDEPVLDALLAFLRQSPLLEEVNLKFYPDSLVPDDRGGRIELRNLKTLLMSFESVASNDTDGPFAIEGFMRKPDLPSLSELRVSFSDCSEDLFESWLSSIFVEESYPLLEELEIQNYIGHGTFNGVYENVGLFERAPNLRHLSLLTPTIPLRVREARSEDGRLKEVILPHLRSLRVMSPNHPLVDNDSIENLVSGVMNSAERAEFEGVEVVQWSAWNPMWSRRPVPADKIKTVPHFLSKLQSRFLTLN